MPIRSRGSTISAIGSSPTFISTSPRSSNVKRGTAQPPSYRNATGCALITASTNTSTG
jgi:hypothetical protein